MKVNESEIDQQQQVETRWIDDQMLDAPIDKECGDSQGYETEQSLAQIDEGLAAAQAGPETRLCARQRLTLGRWSNRHPDGPLESDHCTQALPSG